MYSTLVGLSINLLILYIIICKKINEQKGLNIKKIINLVFIKILYCSKEDNYNIISIFYLSY